MLEIIGAFLLTEWLRTFTQGNSRLETVDLRLLFVVIVGTIYGLHAGVFAAVLACAGVAMSYASQGASFAPLFYDTSNWLAFVIYFVAGSVCGYVQSRNQESVRFVRDENGLLRNRLDFLRGLYQDVLDDRRQLRDQIIGRRDSFGKLYAVTRELDEVQPQKLYHTAIRIMQESLDSDSLAIFRVDNGGQFARLVAASPRFDVGSFRSVRVSDYGEIITALEHNGIWVNRTLRDKFPMYAVGVRDRGELAVIITMGEAKPDQMNLYFQNLFSIMCGLVESAMIRAFEYEDVARRSMLVPGTNLLKPEAFLPKVLAANDLKHDHMGDHLLLKVECEGNLEDVDSLLMQSIRQTDEAGMLTDDGVYLLMSQAGEKELPIILKRLTRSGLHCSYVPQTQEDALLSEAQSHIAQADDGGES